MARRRFTPLIDRAKTGPGRVALVLLMLLCILAWALAWDRIDSDNAGGTGQSSVSTAMHAPESFVGNNPRHTPRKRCYRSFSKYTGVFCRSYAADARIKHKVIKCSGAVVIGYLFGDKKAAMGTFAGCIWTWVY